MNATSQTRMIDTAKAHFEQTDNGNFPVELFAPDFEFYFPKFGVGRGVDEFRELASGLRAAGLRFQHHRDQLKYMVSGQHLIVEGTTLGSDTEGRSWNGGETPGGRFSSVFDFNDAGLIARMFIYLDPDYTSLDNDRFHWKRAKARW